MTAMRTRAGQAGGAAMVGAVLTMLLGPPGPAPAADAQWNATSGSFQTADNWNPQNVPGFFDHASFLVLQP